MIRLRTVDVWDTLLRRKCHPDAVKLHLCNQLLWGHWDAIAPSLREPRALLRLRLDVERDQGRRCAGDPACDDEYQLREVLAEWLGRALLAPPPPGLVEALEAEEFAQEQAVSYADPGITAVLARQPAQQTLFLSDFYMPGARLGQLLHLKGIAIDKGYSSCDVRLNKRSGRLYATVQQRHGVTPAQHLHVGDNARSDVAVPLGLGMSALLYRPAAEERQRRREHAALNDRMGLFRRIRRDCLAAAPALPRGAVGDGFRYGIELAPLFLGFALFVLESVRRERADRLFFFSREGEFFARVYQALLEGSGLGRDTAPPALLEVSRIATFAASLQEVSLQEMMRLWRAYDPQSLRAWAQSLDLDGGTAALWCARHGVPFDQALLHPWQDPRVAQLLADPECRAALMELIERKRVPLLQYLESRGLRDDGGTVAVVDLGWRGTIQDNLALLLPRTQFRGSYLGLQGFLNPQPPNGRKAAYGPDLNQPGEQPRLFGKLPLIEMLCNSPHGSVSGYTRGTDGTVRALRLRDTAEDRAWFKVAAHIQAGVLHAGGIWADYIRCHALCSDELRGSALRLWAGLIRRPPPALARAYAGRKHNELFGRGSF
jgi:FMN phosphatase YigB (HAD superfamily)